MIILNMYSLQDLSRNCIFKNKINDIELPKSLQGLNLEKACNENSLLLIQNFIPDSLTKSLHQKSLPLDELCCINNISLLSFVNRNIGFTKDDFIEMLKISVIKGFINILIYILESKRLNIDDIRSNNNEVLRWSASRGHNEILKLLLNYGNSLNINENKC